MNNLLNNKYSLGFFPTPIHRLNNISKKFPDYDIYIKRDDLTGLALGGNKIRKIEYLIYDAISNKCNTIITAGAQQSNHCRQTAAACAKAGLECHLLLGGSKPVSLTGNLLLSELLGANIHFTGENRKGEDIETYKSRLENENKICYCIPYGGSNEIGALGYVNASLELSEQLKLSGNNFDYVFFPSSSGGTQAGLTLGFELFKINSSLIPVSIDKTESANNKLATTVNELILKCSSLLECNFNLKSNNIFIESNYDKNGYGNTSQAEINTIQLAAKEEGILLDPVYSGRAFHAMLDYLNNNKIPAHSKILFWHTGGTPAIFA